MSKKSSLLVGMAAAAGKQAAPPAVIEERTAGKGSKAKMTDDTVLVGAHWPKEVRSALKYLEAKTGKKLKPLLGEAINDICAKYGMAQPCTVEE